MKPASALKRAMATAVAFLFSAVIFFSCGKKGPIPFDPAFAQYISAYTTGTISAAGTIRVRLTDAFMGDVKTGEPLAEELLDFSPDIDGELFWIDNQTLEFRPKEWLERGKVFDATLRLDKITQAPSNLSKFKFNFVVIKQHLDFEIDNIHPYRNDDLSWIQISGTLKTIDVCDNTVLPKTITASENGRELAVSWATDNDANLHHFTIDSIARTNAEEKVMIQWNGEALGSGQKGEYGQDIPALSNFTVFFHKIIQQPDQYVQLLFSDPLLPGQSLDGLIDLTSMNGERFAIEGNEVRIYPAYRLSGEQALYVHAGIKNLAGATSQQEQTFQLLFEEMKPEVKIDDPERVILPSTDGLVFPFRAVNLSAVDVRVMCIYENNIPQFLQVNDMGGENQMRRVGRTVKRKTVQLNADGNTDLAIWNDFYLNLDEIIQAEPGAIYRVEISFKRAYSLYHCTGEDGGNTDEDRMQELSTEEVDNGEDQDNSNGYYDEYGDYYYDDEYYYEEYDYSQRDNPCSNEYYNRGPLGKNILASDIGMIAKRGNDNSMFFAISDIKTTKPLSGVELDIVNYQQQIIATAKTDGDGLAQIEKVPGVPFLVIAKQDKQRGYLKVDGSHALNASTFDVSGQVSQKGLKGFIYGERGVWRPGDSLFVSFILEDEKKALPEIHPVNFELVNPRGQVVQHMVRSKGENGFFSFNCRTDPDAETGNYQANVRVGGATFSRTIKIETIKPNRLKIGLDFGDKNLSTMSGDATGQLSVKWLHGATAKNLKANITATFSQSSTSFEKYKEFVFDDPVKTFTAEEQVIYDGYINSEGNAAITMKTDLDGRAPGMLNANFSVKVFEEGGDFSVDRFSMPYAPYSSFVGVNVPEPKGQYSYALETGADHKIDVVTVDAQGKPTSLQNLQWKLYKVQWRWWWERSGSDLSNYVGNESTTPVAQGNLDTGNDGKGAFNIRVEYPEWGRYLVRIEDPEGGHATGETIYIDWPATENRDNRENPDGANVLSFVLDKEKYITGEECTITIPSGNAGRALVSIENSVGVITAEWIETKQGQTVYKFKTDERMTPNAYVNITLIQPHNQTVNDLPIRLYGIMPLFVENPGSHLIPLIAMADELSPEKEFEVKVGEKDGKAMTYTLEIVDEGLLDLTRFGTPDPWNHFYAREALGVNTFDLYDQVIGAFGSKLEKLLSLGGSDAAGGKGKNRANRFKPVVMHAGPFTLEKGKTRTHKFTMPNYIGSVRVMVVAGKDMAYGNAEKAVPVKKPLMVLASLPRVLGPGEEVKLPVTVFAMDQSIHDVNVKVDANEYFTLVEGGSKSIKFAEQGDDVINFPIKVNDKVGVGRINVTVTSGSFKSTYEVELDVRNPNPPVTNVIDAVVEAGGNWSATFDLAGMDGTNAAILEVSSIPPVDFGRRLKYLMDYPHGCIEQTTSSVFPQLFLADVVELTEAEIKMTTRNVQAGIDHLSRFQLRSGGMSYWPGDTHEDEWGTCYAGHFMLEAKKKGFTPPANWEANWVNYQRKLAQAWWPQDYRSGNYYWRENDLVQAYRLYTLALAGKAEMGAMNRLKESINLSLAARWRLAAAYAMAGQPETGKALIKGQSTAIPYYVSLGYTYGSNWRDEAMIIETLTLLNDRTQAAPLVKDLAAQLSADTWYSTQTVAYGLLAIAEFAGGEKGRTIGCTYSLNGKAADKHTDKPVTKDNLSVAKLSGNKIDFKNTGSSMLYVRVITTGQPKNGAEQEATNNLYVEVNYKDIKGNAINVSRIDQGTDFIAEVKVWNPGARGRYDELALSQIFPSGWEIINNRMDASAMVMTADRPEYQDIRDDRIYSYFDLNPNQTVIFRVKLNASYLGKFYLPATSAEAMYDATINGRTKGQWVEVVQPGVGSTVQK